MQTLIFLWAFFFDVSAFLSLLGGSLQNATSDCPGMKKKATSLKTTRGRKSSSSSSSAKSRSSSRSTSPHAQRPKPPKQHSLLKLSSKSPLQVQRRGRRGSLCQLKEGDVIVPQKHDEASELKHEDLLKELLRSPFDNVLDTSPDSGLWCATRAKLTKGTIFAVATDPDQFLLLSANIMLSAAKNVVPISTFWPLPIDQLPTIALLKLGSNKCIQTWELLLRRDRPKLVFDCVVTRENHEFLQTLGYRISQDLRWAEQVNQ